MEAAPACALALVRGHRRQLPTMRGPGHLPPETAMSIERWSNSRSVEIENGTDTTGTIVVGPAAGGLIKFPAGVTSPATWEAKDSAGVWAAIHDDSDAALSSAFTAVKWRPIPEGVLLHSEVRAVTGGNVSGDKTVEIALKG